MIQLLALITTALGYYFDFPLDPLTETFRYLGPGNHPDLYYVAVKKGACPTSPDTIGFFGNYSMGYGAQFIEVCLDLESGTISGVEKNFGVGTEKKYTAKPTDASLKFDYAKGLDLLRGYSSLLVKGHDYFPRPQPPKPELQQALEYAKSASKEYMKVVKGVIGGWLPKDLEFGTPTRLYFEYQSLTDVDILVRQFDNTQFYKEERFDGFGGLWNSTSIVFTTPSDITDLASYQLQLAIVPKAASIDQALDKFQGSSNFLKKDRIAYMYCTYQPNLGTNMTCYYSIRTSRDLKVLFTFEKDQVFARDTRDSHLTDPWIVYIDPSWPLGNYRAIAQLVDANGVVDEKIEQVIVVA